MVFLKGIQMNDNDRMEDLVEDIEEAVDDLKELVGEEDVDGEDVEVEKEGIRPIDFTDPDERAKFWVYKARKR